MYKRQTLKVAQVPAVFLAQPYNGKITPIGFGVLSESQLLERIAIVSGPQAEAMLPATTHSLALPPEIPCTPPTIPRCCLLYTSRCV